MIVYLFNALAMFPIDYHGRILWTHPTELTPQQFQEHFLRRMVARLEKEKGKVSVSGNRIAFTGGMFRWVNKSNILSPITKGYIEIRQDDHQFVVSYYLNLTQLLIVVVLMMVWMWFNVAHFWANSAHSDTMAHLVAALIGTWLFGVNFVILIVRFPMMLRAVLRSVDPQHRVFPER